jgi:regulator of RNase E activity RraA
MLNRYDIGEMPPRASAEVIALLGGCETATIGHWRQWGFCDRHIAAVIPARRVVGRAITVALPGPCSTLLHYAVDMVGEGDILVVDRLGDDRYACWGGGMTVAVRAAGGVAGVVDGPCTDLEEIVQSDFPMWCRGFAPITTRQYDLGGRLNRPVSVGGVVVMPGDIIVCDASGVLVLPPDQAEAEARRALHTQAAGRDFEARIAEGARLSDLFGARARVAAAREK